MSRVQRVTAIPSSARIICGASNTADIHEGQWVLDEAGGASRPRVVPHAELDCENGDAENLEEAPHAPSDRKPGESAIKI